MIEKDIYNRKGARKVQDVPTDVLDLLNRGRIPTVNLTEWLAVDHRQLVAATFPEMGLGDSIEAITTAVGQQKKPTAMASTKIVGQCLYTHCRPSGTLALALDHLSRHVSDTLRGYATYLIALDTDLDISQKLVQSRSLIADTHFGIREVVWMALRPEIEQHLEKSIALLSQWTQESDENIRRFTTESTRPRGVWCKHIEALKEQPERALPILEPLKSDTSKYVQDSVGNWLNDASKSRPDFVTELCARWQSESPGPETGKIIKRALRTLKK